MFTLSSLRCTLKIGAGVMKVAKQENIKTILIDIRKMLRWFLSGEGAIVTLSLLVLAAIIGFLIQDAIQKQRYLELLQLELRANYNTATNEIKNVNNHQYLYFHVPFHAEVYNAGLQQGYIITLNPNTQAQLYSFYNTFLPAENVLTQRDMDIINEYETKWEQCIIDNNQLVIKSSPLCDSEHSTYLTVQQTYSEFIARSEVNVWQNISKINFNPTEDRLHPKNLAGLILRLLLGPDSLKIQQ